MSDCRCDCNSAPTISLFRNNALAPGLFHVCMHALPASASASAASAASTASPASAASPANACISISICSTCGVCVFVYVYVHQVLNFCVLDTAHTNVGMGASELSVYPTIQLSFFMGKKRTATCTQGSTSSHPCAAHLLRLKLTFQRAQIQLFPPHHF